MPETRTRPAVVIVGLLVCVGLIVFRAHVRPAMRATASNMRRPFSKERTVEDRMREYGETVRQRLEPDFRRAKISYPPAALTFVGLKQEKSLEVYAADRDGTFRFIRAYPILAASGKAGPKFHEGDSQVPEGFYRIESLNPNSLFHVSLRISYPSEFDRAKATAENRDQLGGDIMIHGGAASIGCLAMGDPAAEDLFVLAARTGLENIRVVLSPYDFRAPGDEVRLPTSPDWLAGLYEQIRGELRRYPKP